MHTSSRICLILNIDLDAPRGKTALSFFNADTDFAAII